MTAYPRIFGIVAVCLLTTVNIAAAAEDTTTPDRALIAAKESFEAAQTLFVKEQFDPAAAKFLEAFDQKPYPAFLFNAAVSYEKAKHLDMAQQYFERYLEKDPGASDAAQVKARIETLKALQAPPPPPTTPPAAPAPDGTPAPVPGAPPAPGAAPGAPPPDGQPAAPGTAPAAPPALSPPPQLTLAAIETKGLVVIDSKPQGATIYLNDKKSGPFAKTPWQGSLESKPVRLLLEAKGFKPEQRAISPRSDKLVDVYIALSEEHFLGWVEIASNAAGAQVFIDRKDIGAIGRTPYTGHLKPGKHTIYLERMGYKPTEKQIDVLPGTATQYTMPMEKGDYGWISVVGRGTYGGRLMVDNKFACATPCRHELLPGKHGVEIEKAGMEDYESDITVERTVETTIDVQFSARPSRRRAWTSAVVAAVLIGAGAYVGSLSNNVKDGIQADYKAGQLVDSNDSRFQKARLEAIGADILYGLGAIVGVSAVFSFLAHGPDSVGVLDQKAIGFAPSLIQGGAGLAASGRF